MWHMMQRPVYLHRSQRLVNYLLNEQPWTGIKRTINLQRRIRKFPRIIIAGLGLANQTLMFHSTPGGKV